MKRLLLLLAVCIPALAQNQFPPINQPVFRAFDSNGVPLVGGLLFSYAAGTTTPLATFTDATGSTPNTNPVVLDSTGSACRSGGGCGVFLGSGSYKFVLQNSAGVVQWTVDQIKGNPTASLTSFNGRNATAVIPTTGDYTCSQVTGCGAALTFSARFVVAGTAVDLANAGTPNTYANPSSITTDAFGRVTAVTAGSAVTLPVIKQQSVTGCVTGTSSFNTCSVTLTWTAAFADASYFPVCTGANPLTDSTGSIGRTLLTGVTAQTASSITIATANEGTASNVGFGIINCIAIHP